MNSYESYMATPESHWYSELPVSWKSQKLKTLFAERRTTVSDKDYPALSVGKVGIVPQLETAVKTNDGNKRKLICAGDFAINSRSDRKGACGISEHTGSCSLIITVLRPHSELNHHFFHYLLRSHFFSEEFYRNGFGIVSDLWTTRWKNMRNIPVPVPPREEQEKIVRFLDWKVSAIDKLIATYKKEITCLEELSQAQIDTTISHLASNPSILKKLKRITACNRSTLDESTPYDYLFRYVDISSVDAKHGITHYEKTVFGKSPSRARRIVHKDDLIVSTVRTYLRAIAKIEDDDNVIVSTGFAVITPQNVDSGYLECLFKSNLFCDEIVRRSIGVSYPSINTSALMDISVPIPSFDTQIDIGKRLTAQRKKINRYIEYKKQRISNLNELKTRLISDAVTGKIDVRSIKLPNFAKEE